jgi:arsenate reductase
MMTKVLFLCTGNSARSQMVEAFLRKFSEGQFEAFSAGLEPKQINPLTIRVTEEIGVEMSGQRSKGINEYLGKGHFQDLVTLRDEAEENCPHV